MRFNIILPLAAIPAVAVNAAPSLTPAGGLWASSSVELKREALTKRAEKSEFNGSKVKADCQWRWLDSNTVDNLHCTVQDVGCDAHEVYAQLELDTNRSGSGNKKCGKIKNASGCHAGAVRDSAARVCNNNDGGSWARARVEACVDDFGSDTCWTGRWVNNPHA